MKQSIPEPAAPQTVTWVPTSADTIVKDADGNILSINGEPVGGANRSPVTIHRSPLSEGSNDA